MAIDHRTPIGRVAAVVSASLRAAGFDAVLTGGACATIYSAGAYTSHDLDFIVRTGGNRKALDDAMAGAGFERSGDRYVHPRTELFVEFPRGPLAIGDDAAIRPVKLRTGRGWVPALSATDACRDRLAAFYHWSDRQSLLEAIDGFPQPRALSDAHSRKAEPQRLTGHCLFKRRTSIQQGMAQLCQLNPIIYQAWLEESAREAPDVNPVSKYVRMHLAFAPA